MGASAHFYNGDQVRKRGARAIPALNQASPADAQQTHARMTPTLSREPSVFGKRISRDELRLIAVGAEETRKKDKRSYNEIHNPDRS